MKGNILTKSATIRDHSTDSATPPQLANKHSLPVKSQNGIRSISCDFQVEIDYYDVLYTKHIKQKSKIWEDGVMEHNLKTSKVRMIYLLFQQVILYARSAKTNQIDSKFFRVKPDMESGSQFQLNKFLVEIEVRFFTKTKILQSKRAEGKGSVKRDCEIEKKSSKKQ